MDLNRHKCVIPNSGIDKKDVIHACNLCSYATKRLPDLVRHMRLKHTDERPFQCQYCHRRFKLKQHVANHEIRCKTDHNKNNHNSDMLSGEKDSMLPTMA